MAFKKAEQQQAFGKVGLYGPAKSGKTYTASLLAIGLAKRIKTKKPIGFIDTETGSDYVIERFKDAGFKLEIDRTRAFKTLLTDIKEAEKNYNILIIDSLSHFWTELLQAYCEKKGKKELAFQDWNIIKPTWQQFTDAYVTSNLHIIICGRAQTIWEYFKNENGKMELYSSGIRMKAEKEAAYEPSLLVEMERITEDKKIIHRATVIGDRAQVLDAKHCDNPTFEFFEPHFDFVLKGKEHKPLDTETTSEDMFEKSTGRPDWKERDIKKSIALEEIQATMVKLWPSSTKEDKLAKQDFLDAVFDTRSWIAVQEKSLRELADVQKVLKEFEANYEKAEKKDIDPIWKTTIIGDMPEFDKSSQDGEDAPGSTQMVFCMLDYTDRPEKDEDSMISLDICDNECDPKTRGECKGYKKVSD